MHGSQPPFVLVEANEVVGKYGEGDFSHLPPKSFETTVPIPKTPAKKSAQTMAGSEESKAWGTFKQGGSNQKIAPDQYWTLPHSIDPLMDFLDVHLDKDTTLIWEPCFGEGGIANPLKAAGFQVVCTDLYTMDEKLSFVDFTDETGVKFEACPVPRGVTHIVTNPPFSIKNQFIKRFYELGLPTFVIMPIDILGTKRDLKMLKENGFNLFLLPGAAASSTFYNKTEDRNVSVGTCAWYGLNLEKSHEIHYL